MNSNTDEPSSSSELRRRPKIVPSPTFIGIDFTWESWTLFVQQRNWSTSDSFETALTSCLYSAAERLIDKDRAMSFLYSWIDSHTDYGISDKQLQSKANTAYRNAEQKLKLKAAGKESSPVAVKLEQFRASLGKKDWTAGMKSEGLGKSIRYARNMKLSPEACQRGIEEHWNALNIQFNPEELRQRIAAEP